MATRRTRISVADLLIQPEPQQQPPRRPPEDDDVVLLDSKPAGEQPTRTIPDRQTGLQLTGHVASSSTSPNSPPQNALSPTHTATTSYYRSPTRYGVPPRPNYYEPYIARTATKSEPTPPIFIQQLQPPVSPPPVILFRATLPIRSAPTTSHPKPYKVPEWARTNTATKPKLIKDGKVIDAVVENEFERKKVARDLVRKKDKERKRNRKRANRREASDSLLGGNGNAMATGSGSGMSATPDPESEVDKGNTAMAVDMESVSISGPAEAPSYSDSEEANFDQYLQYPSSSPPPPLRHTSIPSVIPVPMSTNSSSDSFIFPPRDTSASRPSDSTTASTTPGTTESPKTPP